MLRGRQGLHLRGVGQLHATLTQRPSHATCTCFRYMHGVNLSATTSTSSSLVRRWIPRTSPLLLHCRPYTPPPPSFKPPPRPPPAAQRNDTPPYGAQRAADPRFGHGPQSVGSMAARADAMPPPGAAFPPPPPTDAPVDAPPERWWPSRLHRFLRFRFVHDLLNLSGWQALLPGRRTPVRFASDNYAEDRSWLVMPVPAAVPLKLSSQLKYLMVEGGILFMVLGGPQMLLQLPAFSALLGSYASILQSLSLSKLVALFTVPIGLELGADTLDMSVFLLGVHWPITIATYLLLHKLARRIWPHFMRMPLPYQDARPRGFLWRLLRRYICFTLLLAVTGWITIQLYRRGFSVHVLNDGAAVEDSRLVELMLDAKGGNLAHLVLLGPLLEELAFRGLIFAKAARIVGIIPALLGSAALFGFIHASTESDKVGPAMIMGASWSMIYTLTHSLLASGALHVAQNAAVALRLAPQSPMHPFSDLSPALAYTHSVEALDSKRIVAKSAEGNTLSLPGWLIPPPTPTRRLTPEAKSCIRSLFDALDRGNKGYLDSAELAWACMLIPKVHAHFNAALGTIERRVGPEEAEATWNRMELPPGTLRQPEKDLPGEGFFQRRPAAQQDAHGRPPATIDGAQPSEAAATASTPAPSASSGLFSPSRTSRLLLQSAPPTLWSALHASPFISPAPSPRASASPDDLSIPPVQGELFARYYALYWQQAYDAYFPSSAHRVEVSMDVDFDVDLEKEGAERRAEVEQRGKEQGREVHLLPRIKFTHAHRLKDGFDPATAVPLGRTCTPDRFESFVLHSLLLRPQETTRWMRTCAEVLEGAHEHPTEALLRAHEQGRQWPRGRVYE